MLRLGKVQRGGIGYYFETSGPGRTGLVEPEGRWLGSLSRALGMEGSIVSEAALRALLEGVDPNTGEILDPQHGRVRVVGFDAVFAAPKSVSVLHAFSGDAVTQAFAEAHEQSVRAVVSYLESHVALLRRTTAEGRRSVQSDRLAAASFLHRTSRAPDPHLHSHVVIANLGVDRSGRWSALDARALFQHQSAAGALYGAELRRELVERLGLSWRVRRRGAVDLAAVPESAIVGFSRRQQQIEAEQARSGGDGPRAARRISDWTRAPKDTETPYEALLEAWRKRAHGLGVRPDALVASSGDRLPNSSVPRDVAVVPAAEAVAGALKGFDRPFVRRELVASAARDLVQGARLIEVERAVEQVLGCESTEVMSAGDVVRADAPRWRNRPPAPVIEPRYLTNDAAARLAELTQAIAGAPDLDLRIGHHQAGSSHGLVSGLVVDRGGDRGALATLVGLRRLADEAVAAGRRVLGVAPFAGLAGHFEALTGVATFEPGRLPHSRHGELVIVFGASRLSPRTAAELLRRADLRETGIVFVDPPAGRAAAGERAATEVRGHEASSCEVVMTPFGEVALAASLEALPDVLGVARRRVEEQGRRPVVAVAERGLAVELGAAQSPREALRAAAGTAEVEVVVVGGARVLPAVGRGESGPRSFVAVLPGRLGASELRRAALELATPPGLARGQYLGRGRSRGDDATAGLSR